MVCAVLVQCLLDRVVPRLRALVLVPTRELVQQVTNVFRALVAGALAGGGAVWGVGTATRAGPNCFAADQQCAPFTTTLFAVAVWTPGTNLVVFSTTGQKSFVSEQAVLGAVAPQLRIELAARVLQAVPLVNHDVAPGQAGQARPTQEGG